MTNNGGTVMDDRLATAIAHVVRDKYFWVGNVFDLDRAMIVAASAVPMGSRMNLCHVKDFVDDYLQGVVGVAGATGVGIAERATRSVHGPEVNAVACIIDRLLSTGAIST
jgi:hypothetical protein